MKNGLRQVKKILAFRNDRFGEFLLNIPALSALKKEYPGAKLVLVTNPYVQELAGLIDSVDEVVTWENRRHRIGEIIRFAASIKKERFDLCVIFNPNKEFNIITFLSGIPERVGYNHKFAFLLTKKIEDRKYLGERHEIEYNLELAAAAGARTQDKTLSLTVDEKIVEDLFMPLNIEKGDTLIALHPWTSDPVKQWPINNFSELAKSLSGVRGVKILVIGGKEEAAKGRDFVDGLKEENIINLAGKTTLVELAATLKRSKLLVSGDSGPVHLAACVSTPVLAVFRNDIQGKNPGRWGPWGKGHIVIEKNNLNDISVQEVFNECIKKFFS